MSADKRKYKAQRLAVLFEAIDRLARHPVSNPDTEIICLASIGFKIATKLAKESHASSQAGREEKP